MGATVHAKACSSIRSYPLLSRSRVHCRRNRCNRLRELGSEVAF